MNAPAELDVFRCPLDGIRLIEASAGTGKTWNICGLYLRLLLERRLDVQQILVVTFTNAATAELRERIRGRIVETLEHLAGRGAGGGDPFVPRLVESLTARGLAPADLATRLDLARQSFDEAAIFTIHGFCQRALADSAFAAGLPMAMELLTDDGEVLLEAVHDFWRRRIAGDALPAELAAHLLACQDSPEKYAGLLRRRLAKPLARVLWPDDGPPPAIDAGPLARAYQAARTTWQDQGEAILGRLLAGLPSLNGVSYKEDALRRGGDQWQAYLAGGDPLAGIGDKQALYRSSVLQERKRKNATPPAHPFFDQADACLAAREALAGALDGARRQLLRQLFEEAGGRLRELKRARRVVSFDDLLYNLHERLHDASAARLAAALRSRFPAALIDEFQDTDPLQFAIFHAIYGGGEAPLFLVGDPKQAIYSFRHADLHTYLAAKRQAAAQHTLVANQRSTAGLLAALNRLFAANRRAFLLAGLDYREVAVGGRPRPPFEDRSEPRGDLHVWLLPTAPEGLLEKLPARRQAIAATAAEIARLLNEAAAGRITLGGRPLRAADIAVLVRSHAQGGDMKQALGRLGVGSVELAQAGVFQSPEAEDLERALRGIAEPARAGRLKAALATSLFGADAAAIEALADDEARLLERIDGCQAYLQLWLRQGFGVMYRRLLTRERVAERLLALADGERRLTNLLHLGECLQQDAERHPSPEALLQRLAARRQEAAADETQQLRLESDRNLVQIVTIHKSKGLEYPVVFCPFLWDGPPRPARGEGLEYHDPEGRPVIDFRGETIDAAERQQIDRTLWLEAAAETLRLIYVALTRAVQRCYLVAGCYLTTSFGRPSATESSRSLLNWLVAGDGTAPADWPQARLAPEAIAAAWARLAEAAGAPLQLAPLLTGPGRPVADGRPAAGSLAALPTPGPIAGGWRLSSYSGLNHGAVHEVAATDHDGRVLPGPPPGAPPALAADDLLRFPRGPLAGECIHRALELADFTDPAGWPSAVAAALQAHPQPGDGLPAMLLAMLRDVTGTELPDGLRLAAIARDRRLSELEFHLPAPRLAADALTDTLRTLGYPGPRLAFGQLQGFLKGYVDLVVEHDGRYYLIDWKSNHLGYGAEDYGADRLAQAMADHGYHLQYLLYAVALRRHLRQRLPGYRDEHHFGGVLYLFVRGVRPAWPGAGVFFHRPASDTLDRLEQLLGMPGETGR